MTALALPDAEARRRAATEFDTNFVVEAGAGTGKTSLLVERLLVAIGAGLVRVTEFAAITFTEKAAGEMRDRLAEGLERLRRAARDGADPDPKKTWGRALAHLVRERGTPPADVAERALAALADMDRAKVTTIHTFCSDLLRTHPFEAGVDPEFEVDRGPIYESLLDEMWEAFLAEELGPGAARPDLWRRLLPRIPLGAVRSLARSLASFGLGEALLAPGRAAGAAALFAGEALELAKKIQSVLARADGMTKATVAIFGAYREALDRLVRDGLPALVEFATQDEILSERLAKDPPKANKKLRNVDPEEMESVAKEAHALIRDLSLVDDEALEDAVEAVAPFALRARRSLLERGAVNFDGLLVLARDLLRDRPEIRDEVRRRHAMLLVDEFQDTDPLQYEIVLFLAGQDGEREQDPFAVPLYPGRLFIVGDPKQSIYRFRGADYSAFRRAVERVIAQGGEELDLVSNFRSVEAVVSPVNDLFRRGWAESDYQPPYIAIEAARPERPGEPRIELLTVEGEAQADARREAEGTVVAERIRRLVEDEERRPRDVLLLLRAFTPLAFYLRPLREAGIPFVVDGGRLFLERTEVAQLMAALRALARPSDPAALLAFLRSPAGGAPDAELLRYAASGGRWRLSETPEGESFPAIARAFGLLRDLSLETADLPADTMVRRVLGRTGLLPLGGIAYEGAQRVANLRKLAAAAADLARDGRLSLNEVLDALEEERAGDVEGDSPLADESGDAVRVLTVHKAKGLESDIVIVGDLARIESGGWRAEKEAAKAVRLPSGAVALALAGGGLRNAARLWLEREEKRHEEAEGMRTLYVALTRARERLILLAAKPTKGRAPWIEALGGWKYSPDDPPRDLEAIQDGRVLHRKTGRVTRPRRAADSVKGEPEAVTAWNEALRAVGAMARPPFRRPSGLKEERAAALAAAEDGSPPVALRREVALAAGTAVHAALERWDPRSGLPPTAALSDLARKAAAEHGADPGEVEREAREVLDTFLASPLAARLRSIEVLGREVPVLLREEDGTTVSGVLDLLYRDSGGEVVVADYKTDRALGAADAVGRYGPQLLAYAETVRRAMRLPAAPRTEIWLVRGGDILLLPAGPR